MNKEDQSLTISEMVKQSHETAKEKGWWDEDREENIPELLCLIHSEVSEALEDFRDGFGTNDIYYRDRDGKPCGIPIELADILIRIGDMCGYYGINLESALKEKMEFNKQRPYRHGNKKV